MKIKKLQAGGIPPIFSTFTPVTVTNPYAGVDPMFSLLQNLASGTTQGSASSSGGGLSVKDTMSLLKDMKGLDSDVSTAINSLQQSAREQALFGGTSSLVSDYYRNIDLANKVNQSKLAYDEAYKLVKENGGISEAAVTSDGKVIVKDANGNINAITPKEYLNNRGKYQIQTNGRLLYDRAHNRKMAFNNAVLEVVQNGTSVDKITETINSISSKLGTSTNSIEGYTAKQAQQIQSGIAILKNAATQNIESMPMDGIYKTGIKDESQQQQVKLAIDAIYTSLSDPQRALLKLKTDGSDNGAKSLVAAILMSRVDESSTVTINYESSLNKDGKEGSEGSESDIEKQVKTNPALQFFLGYGSKSTLVIQNKTQNGIIFTANNMPIMDKSNNPLPIGSLYDVAQGQFGGLLNISSATMGDARINPSGINNVIIEGGQIYSAELPIDPNSKVLKPDVRFLQAIEEANTELRSMGINPSGGNTLTAEAIKTINRVYEKHKLPVKYQSNGELKPQYARFAMINGTATKEAFVEDPEFGTGIMEVKDKNERANFETNMRKTGNSEFKLNDGFFSSDKLYKGTIFIPIYNNIWNAMATTESKVSPGVSQQIETLQQQTDLRMNYKSPGAWVK